MLARTLSCLTAMILILSSPARAERPWMLTPLAVRAGEVDVEFRWIQSEPHCLVPGWCDFEKWLTVEVSPCPPGEPCTDGVYTRTYDHELTSTGRLTLALHTTYEFSGSYTARTLGPDAQSQCSILLCEETVPIACAAPAA